MFPAPPVLRAELVCPCAVVLDCRLDPPPPDTVPGSQSKVLALYKSACPFVGATEKRSTSARPVKLVDEPIQFVPS